nr:MAG: Protein of unknown function (DUF1642) [Bacteriophage sp.]
MDRQEAVNREEAVRTISRISGGSVSYAEDLYDSFFPKPVVSQVVTDWYEGHKDEFEINLYREVCRSEENYNCGGLTDFQEWLISGKTSSFSVLVNMHQFGYEVEKEPRYTVRIKGVSEINRYLNKENDKEFLFSDSEESEDYRTKFTRKELEEADFGWVFDCPGVEVTEVTDGND